MLRCHRAEMRVMVELIGDYELSDQLDADMEYYNSDDVSDCFYMSLDEDESCKWDEGSEDADDPLKDALDELADRQALIAAITPAAPMLTELARVRLDLERAAMQREDLLSARV